MDDKNFLREHMDGLRSAREVTASRHASFVMETVKHLALINIAGLAGSTALLQVRNLEGLGLTVSVICFFAGLILAVVDLYLNSLGHLARVKEHDRAIDATWKAGVSNSFETKPNSPMPDLKKGSCAFLAAGAVGWLSGIFAIIGALIVACALFSGRSPDPYVDPASTSPFSLCYAPESAGLSGRFVTPGDYESSLSR